MRYQRAVAGIALLSQLLGSGTPVIAQQKPELEKIYRMNSIGQKGDIHYDGARFDFFEDGVSYSVPKPENFVYTITGKKVKKISSGGGFIPYTEFREYTRLKKSSGEQGDNRLNTFLKRFQNPDFVQSVLEFVLRNELPDYINSKIKPKNSELQTRPYQSPQKVGETPQGTPLEDILQSGYVELPQGRFRFNKIKGSQFFYWREGEENRIYVLDLNKINTPKEAAIAVGMIDSIRGKLKEPDGSKITTDREKTISPPLDVILSK
ncbi:hypothetical protein HYX07_03985 [Candidatus Woesearchaeota archaeon]|nr:hypothetical protein [Candidatus Woesearchaeota archaeon]